MQGVAAQVRVIWRPQERLVCFLHSIVWYPKYVVYTVEARRRSMILDASFTRVYSERRVSCYFTGAIVVVIELCGRCPSFNM